MLCVSGCVYKNINSREATNYLWPLDVVSSHLSSVHHAAGHVLSVAGVALHHHRGWFEHRHGDLSHGKLLMVCLLCGDHRGIGGQHEVNARVGHQIGLELGDIHVQGTIEAEGGLRSETQLHLPCKIEIQNKTKNITSVIASFNQTAWNLPPLH